MRGTIRSIVVTGMSFFAFLGLAVASFAADVKVRLKIPNIYCASKGAAATDAAKSIPSVSFADDNPDQNTLTIVFDDTKTNLVTLQKELHAAGFPVIGEEFLGR